MYLAIIYTDTAIRKKRLCFIHSVPRARHIPPNNFQVQRTQVFLSLCFLERCIIGMLSDDSELEPEVLASFSSSSLP